MAIVKNDPEIGAVCSGKTHTLKIFFECVIDFIQYAICPADNATAGSLGRRRAGQLRFGFVAVLEGHIVYG
jgi:hypothetical protein